MSSELLQHVTTVATDLVDALRPYTQRDRTAADLDDRFVGGVHAALQKALDALAATDCWGPDNRLPSGDFWKLAGPTLARGPLQRHAREKPHGYAGDFEMLQMICDNVRHGTGIAWAFDDFFQRQAAPHAVRNRALLVAEELATHVTHNPDRPSRVVSVGSGPAADLARFGQTHPDSAANVNVVLLDLDPRALEHASQTLTPLFSPGAVTAHRVNLKRLPRMGDAQAWMQNADFIFCAGFLDYLEQATAAQLLETLWQPLSAGGQLLVFNFAENNPSRAYMEWVGNWYLTYRSRDDLAEVGQRAGIPARDFTVDVEPAGVNLYMHACKG